MDPANLLTKRQWIAELARRKPGGVLHSLNHVIDFEWVREAYVRTRKDGATGIDGMTAADYEANLEANLSDLLERIKSGRYHAPFDFLGFTHTWTKSQTGKNVVRQRTAKRRLARALVAVNDWCRQNRHRPVREQQVKLSAKLIGHYAYYGITGNSEHIGRFFQQVYRSWKKWLERRTRGQPLTWDAFSAPPTRHALPRPRIVHSYVAAQRNSPVKNRMR